MNPSTSGRPLRIIMTAMAARMRAATFETARDPAGPRIRVRRSALADGLPARKPEPPGLGWGQDRLDDGP